MLVLGQYRYPQVMVGLENKVLVVYSLDNFIPRQVRGKSAGRGRRDHLPNYALDRRAYCPYATIPDTEYT